MRFNNTKHIYNYTIELHVECSLSLRNECIKTYVSDEVWAVLRGGYVKVNPKGISCL